MDIKRNFLKIRLIQDFFDVGAIEKNKEKILIKFDQANNENIDLIIFPELALTGYLPEDLLFNKAFIDKTQQNLSEIIKHTKNKDCYILVGTVTKKENELFNNATLIGKGKIISQQNKTNLPNYLLFDEKRYFSKNRDFNVIKLKNFSLGIMICEDAWNDSVANILALKKIDLFIIINASPFSYNKYQQRLAKATNHVKRFNIPLIYLNHVGAQDDITFDGNSFILNHKATITHQLKSWAYDQADLLFKNDNSIKIINPHNNNLVINYPESYYQACIISLKEFLRKNNINKVVLGLSGGIDSALVATIASDAIGADKVTTIMMYTKYTSQNSIIDAKELSQNLGTNHIEINIQDIIDNLNDKLMPFFADLPFDHTEENIQSRIRAVILMAFSNKFNCLLLATGNKSEIAVGYTTIYGDMCGGYNVLKDIYKTQIYELAQYRNSVKMQNTNDKISVIPQNIIIKPPSAELKPNQTDQDSLPPYEILDKILFALIEENKTIQEIIASGYDKELVTKINKMLLNAEHKRRQSPPGTIVSNMSFGKDRRYPISNNFDYLK